VGFRSTGILLVVAVLLGAFIYLYEMREETSGASDEAAEALVFPGVESDAIEAIELDTTDARHARVERRDTGWMLVEPLSFGGDDVAIEAIASALAQLEAAGRVEGGADAGDFGLGDGADEVAFEIAGDRRVLRIGAGTPVGSNTYVQIGEGGELAYVQTWRINALRKSLGEIRNRRILDFDHAAVSEISVRWPDGRAELERRGEEWWLTQPLEERADQRVVQNLLSDLAFLQAEDFIDERPPEDELGMAAPRFQVVIGGEKGGSEPSPFKLGFAIGADRAGALVARGSGGHLYALPPGRLDDFPRSLFAYRFKELARFEVADARRFELIYLLGDEGSETGLHTVSGKLVDDAWQTAPDEMDPQRASAMVTELARLEASELVADALGEDERAAIELAPPRLTVRVYGAGTAEQGQAGEVVLADFALGSQQPGRGILARRADSPVIYRVAEVTSAVVPQSPEALRAEFGPQPPSVLEEIEGVTGAGEGGLEEPAGDSGGAPGI
jgi:hypothetical protein